MWAPTLHTLLAQNFWAILLQTVLFGIYLLLFGVSVYCHLNHTNNRLSGGSVHTCMMLFGVILCSVITAHWLLSCVRAFRAFVFDADERTETIAFLSNFGHPTWVASVVMQHLVRLLMDGLLVARLSVFWKSRFWVIALPSATVIGDAVASTINYYYAAHFDGIAGPNWAKELIWIKASYCFSCVTNVLASSLIMWRVFSQNRALSEFKLRTRLLPYMTAIVESASLYTIFNVIQVILVSTGSPGALVSFVTVIPLNGIVYTLIVLQFRLGLTSRVPDSADQLSTRRPSLVPVVFPSSFGVEAPSALIPLDTLRHMPAMASNPSLSAKHAGGSLSC